MKYPYKKQTEKNLLECIKQYYPDAVDSIREYPSKEKAQEDWKRELGCELSELDKLTGWNNRYYNSNDPLNDMSAKERLLGNEKLIGKAFAMQTFYQGLDVSVEVLANCDEYEVMDGWIRMYILDETDCIDRVIGIIYDMTDKEVRDYLK